MIEIVGVRFQNSGKVYYFAPTGLQLPLGTEVVVETARGLECGVVTIANRKIEDEGVVAPLKPVVRIMTKEDRRNQEQNRQKEKRAFQVCEEKIATRGLNMKLVDVTCTFDNSKLLFYFTADSRVDFRELVKDLASVFRMRIELRQMACVTRRRCSAVLACAAENFAAEAIWGISSRCPSKWQRSRDCHSIRPRFREPAAD